MKKELVAFEGVNFRRDGRVILKDVHWKIMEGENWALLGLNGSGKSTLLSMIPAYTYPSQGIVRVFGHQFGKYQWDKIRSRIGFLSSTLDLFSSTMGSSYIDEIILSGKRGTARVYEEVTEEDREKARHLVEEFELGHILQTRFRDMSHGEKRRALVARAFMNEPSLMILDEPCASLDLRARERLLKSLNNEVSGNKYPFIYVTHQIEEIIPAISHVAILHRGEILQAGPKHDVIKDTYLSQLYEMDLRVEWEGERPWIIIK